MAGKHKWLLHSADIRGEEYVAEPTRKFHKKLITSYIIWTLLHPSFSYLTFPSIFL